MKKMTVILAVAAAALTLASCNKEPELLPTNSQESSAASASTQTKPDLLVSGSWHQTGLTVSAPIEGSSQVASTDMFTRAKPAMLIRMATFKADGTYTQLRGPRPDQAVAEPTTGTWRLNAAADSLFITETNNTHHLAVAELNGSTLSLTFIDGGKGSKGSTYTSVFAH